MKDLWFVLKNKVIHRRKWLAVHETKVERTMLKLHGDVFVDIGANQKRYANLMRNNFKRIVTVDPNPKWNADLQVAISSFNGTKPFYIGDNEGSADSLLEKPHIQGREWTNEKGYMVTVRTFDSLELEANLVKIDVEGAEFDVLDGMKNLRPTNIIVELHDERRRLELILKMTGRGYLPKRIDKTHWLFKRLDIE